MIAFVFALTLSVLPCDNQVGIETASQLAEEIRNVWDTQVATDSVSGRKLRDQVQAVGTRIRWTNEHSSRMDLFSRYENFWVSQESPEQTIRTLSLDSQQLIFQSRRWKHAEHGQLETIRTQQSKSAQQYLGDRRNPADFLPALYDHFEPARADYSTPWKFFRCWSPARDTIHWLDERMGRLCVTHQSSPELVGQSWALLSTDEHLSDQLDTLGMMAALIAVAPGHSLLHGPRPEFQILDDEVEIAGFPCRVLRQDRQSEDLSRTWYVDAELNWRVLRYVGRSSSHTAQIDIRYEPVAGDSKPDPWRKPAGWSCMIFSNDEAPVQAFCKSSVQNVTFEAPSLPNTYREALPAGTWVVDKRNDSQYVVTAAGGRRIITQQELQFYPTHAEIIATAQGKLVPSIEKKIFWNRLLRNPHLWLVVVVCAIACSIVLSKRRRQ